MAIVATSPIMKGLSGMLGKSIVFKRWGDRTIVATYTKSMKQQSDQQKQNRSKFRDASFWAKIILRDPAQKAYYQKKAKKLGLPNAYTAAITDYMRKPKVESSSHRSGTTTYYISKKGFAIRRAEAQIISSGGVEQVQTFDAHASGECVVALPELAAGEQLKWTVVDDVGRRIEL